MDSYPVADPTGTRSSRDDVPTMSTVSPPPLDTPMIVEQHHSSWSWPVAPPQAHLVSQGTRPYSQNATDHIIASQNFDALLQPHPAQLGLSNPFAPSSTSNSSTSPLIDDPRRRTSSSLLSLASSNGTGARSSLSARYERYLDVEDPHTLGDNPLGAAGMDSQSMRYMTVSPFSGSDLRSSPGSMDPLEDEEDEDEDAGTSSFSYTGDVTNLSAFKGVTSRSSSLNHHHQHHRQQAPGGGSGNQDRRARHKCTPAQVAELSAFFQYSRNPTGKARADLAQRLGMPERSVQIWFQNRRAKLRPKMDESQTISPITSASSPPSTKSNHSGLQDPNILVKRTSQSSPLRKSRKKRQETTEACQESITFLPSHSVSIGTWRRVQPLTCFFSRNGRTLTWALKSDSVGFKLELPWNSISEMTFNGPVSPAVAEIAEGISEPLGLLCVRLSRPPIFSMEVFRSASRPGERGPNGARWRQCEDFTEARQGTTTLTHVLSGPFHELREAVMQLKSCHNDLNAKTHLLDQITMLNPTQEYRNESEEVDTDMLSMNNSLRNLPQYHSFHDREKEDLPASTDYESYVSSLSNDLSTSQPSGVVGSQEGFSNLSSTTTNDTRLSSEGGQHFSHLSDPQNFDAITQSHLSLVPPATAAAGFPFSAGALPDKHINLHPGRIGGGGGGGEGDGGAHWLGLSQSSQHQQQHHQQQQHQQQQRSTHLEPQDPVLQASSLRSAPMERQVELEHIASYTPSNVASLSVNHHHMGSSTNQMEEEEGDQQLLSITLPTTLVETSKDRNDDRGDANSLSIYGQQPQPQLQQQHRQQRDTTPRRLSNNSLGLVEDSNMTTSH